jgi:excinuclease ABC subunit C
MKNRSGKIIYIGKASNLRKRISSYFTKESSVHPKTERMVKKIERIDFIVTENEIDALVLEANLIKLHKPEYNVKYKDDKKYPFIKVTVHEEYPRIFPTRNIKKDGSMLLGPYTDVKAVKKTIKAGRGIFPTRSCGKKMPSKECLDYHIGICSAPCIGCVSVKEYRKIVDDFVKFLEGKQSTLERDLTKLMNKYSENLEYEKAKEVRDRINALKKVQSRQKVVFQKNLDIDIIGCAHSGKIFSFVVDDVREGKLIYQNNYFLEGISDLNEAMEMFITGYYREKPFIPPEIVVDVLPTNKRILENWLSLRRKRKVTIKNRIKKKRLSLLRLAHKNAEFYLSDTLEKRSEKKISNEVRELMKVLKLKKPPVTIEAFDISNIMGEHAVGSSVLFVNGKPRKRGYLHYRIRGVEGINDVAMIKEVISRRLNRIIKLKQEKPDLLIIDGGEGQLNAAVSVLKEKGFQIPVISIAKKYEEIHLVGKKVVNLLGDSIALKLMKRIRDESHRFAIQYYRKLHQKEVKSSIIDDLPGIGKEKKKTLLSYFGSVERLKRASVEDIREVDGFGEKTARRVWEYLREK